MGGNCLVYDAFFGAGSDKAECEFGQGHVGMSDRSDCPFKMGSMCLRV